MTTDQSKLPVKFVIAQKQKYFIIAITCMHACREYSISIAVHMAYKLIKIAPKNNDNTLCRARGNTHISYIKELTNV